MVQAGIETQLILCQIFYHRTIVILRKSEGIFSLNLFTYTLSVT